ncbi:hypothetical protein BT69DRAFT_1345579 [Atractiella rhizophila]|nr:hypothetical protein BT69DRAFT_1345579 [Atractiella rhizophila]
MGIKNKPKESQGFETLKVGGVEYNSLGHDDRLLLAFDKQQFNFLRQCEILRWVEPSGPLPALAIPDEFVTSLKTCPTAQIYDKMRLLAKAALLPTVREEADCVTSDGSKPGAGMSPAKNEDSLPSSSLKTLASSETEGGVSQSQATQDEDIWEFSDADILLAEEELLSKETTEDAPELEDAPIDTATQKHLDMMFSQAYPEILNVDMPESDDSFMEDIVASELPKARTVNSRKDEPSSPPRSPPPAFPEDGVPLTDRPSTVDIAHIKARINSVPRMSSLALKKMYGNLPFDQYTPAHGQHEKEALEHAVIHFRGTLALANGQLSITQHAPVSDKGYRFSYKSGSDRFFRMRLDAELEKFVQRNCDAQPARLDFIQEFLDRPIIFNGRIFSPFSLKDGAINYFAERNIPNEVWGFSKYLARFHLGLSRTIQTVTFSRDQVRRVPDVFVSSLRISPTAMKRLAGGVDLRYIPRVEGTQTWFTDFDKTSTFQLGEDKIEIRRAHLPPDWTRSQKIVIHPQRLDFDNRTITHRSITFKAVNIVIKDEEPPTLKEEVEKETTAVVRLFDQEMTDGCGFISRKAVDRIYRMLGTEEFPSAIQARCGPAKGLWMVDPCEDMSAEWIEIRDSQYKWAVNSSTKFCFEVLKVSKPPIEGAIGKQAIQVLAHNGVPNSVFEKKLDAELRNIVGGLLNWSDPTVLIQNVEIAENLAQKRLRDIMTVSNIFSSGEQTGDEDDGDAELDSFGLQSGDDLEPFSGAPQTIGEVVVSLLRAGFNPRTNVALASKVQRLGVALINRSIQYRLPLKCSTVLYAIADPLAVLRPGEVFIQFSRHMQHPVHESGFVFNLRGMHVLATRSPCVSASGVRKYRCAYYMQLAHYFNVVVYPSIGDRPEISLHGGGDYDGDTSLIIWDPAIVDPFVNSGLEHATCPMKDEQIFDVQTTTVDTEIRSTTDQLLTRKLLSPLFFPSHFKIFSRWHTLLMYQEGLGHPLVRMLGHLFEKTLDSAKAGHALKPQLAIYVRNQVERCCRAQGNDMAAMPGWTSADTKYSKPPRRSRRLAKEGTYVMDDLKATGDELVAEFKIDFPKSLRQTVIEEDTDISDVWTNHQKFESVDLQHDLHRIQKHVKACFEEFQGLWKPGTKESYFMKRLRSSELAKKFATFPNARMGEEPYQSELLLSPSGPYIARQLKASLAYSLPYRDGRKFSSSRSPIACGSDPLSTFVLEMDFRTLCNLKSSAMDRKYFQNRLPTDVLKSLQSFGFAHAWKAAVVHW